MNSKVLAFLVISNILYAGNNGFLQNQKYVCISQGILMNNEIVPVFSQEEAMKHPLRIMVDKNNILHTDSQLDLKLSHIEKTVYGNEENKIILGVENDKRFIIQISKAMKNVPMLFNCVETENWTIAR